MKNEINTDLIPRQTVAAIVENVDIAKREVEQALTLLVQAKKRLYSTLGEDDFYHHIFDRHVDDYQLEPDHAKETIEQSINRITRNAWRYILAQTGLCKFMTARRKEELEEQIEKNSLPPLTAENIYGTLQGLHKKASGLLEESIREVFNWLRPRTDYGVGSLKTNKRFSVGPKVIVGWAVEYGYGVKYRFQYKNEQRFTSLANTFSLLDGKGVQQYPDDFVSKCKAAMAENAESFEDDYFKCKFYGNGNMHIQFKRLDLLAMLNKIGGGEGLPEQDNMTKREERKHAVVCSL